MNGTRETSEQRFWRRVEKTETCWIWTGAMHKTGYGKFYVGSRHIRAHRYSYERFVMPIPFGLMLDHLCRNRACVNPAHLEPVTAQENVRRALPYRVKKTVCPQGHEFAITGATNSKGFQYCTLCQRESQRKSDLRRIPCQACGKTLSVGHMKRHRTTSRHKRLEGEMNGKR